MSWDVEGIIAESDSAKDGDEATASYCAEITDSSNEELVNSWNQAMSDSCDMDD